MKKITFALIFLSCVLQLFGQIPYGNNPAAGKYVQTKDALRGHGKSEIGSRDYSYDLFADDIMQVMDKEKVDRFSILGFSSGAITATRIAADHLPHFIGITGQDHD